MSELKEGAVVQGEVISTKPFGAFIKLESGETGLVHISQISTKYVEKVEDELQVGAVVKAKVLSIDPSGKISLSIKALSEDRPPRERRGGGDRRGGRKGPADFEDMMKKWLKSSEERLSALAAKQKKNR
ncbi:S1 RNA-binding domain-containing protein [Paenactinomyces guangxiensis]|uniref:S1 RNA-binding domain-containing protein n=1 Tax=Paenactinomyces guangxiensis TaxID=1490290 RepID=A0A7W2A949_9BACL|nr:S1 RNA-binding domain-containing protein [Paenactinomyces guangxiensis]MBA4494854.1 S1 RNA-binding domain-containing protein [Paenactinomyces guangxiensis]MBH8591937.1 S1 RNA-binding domain-containing protein [Paenactinomyces guangxiensis]